MPDVNLEALIAQAREGGDTPSITFPFNGEKFSMPNPLYADDEWKADFEAVEGGEVANARFLLGDDEWEKFKNLGGQSWMVGLALADGIGQSQDRMLDGTPTRSGTSSARPRRPSKRR